MELKDSQFAETRVLLLRGVNLGTRNKVNMKDLTTELARHGLEQVQTYLQSGNLVVRTALQSEEVRRRVENRLQEKYGIREPVLVRSRQEWTKLMQALPAPSDSELIHVVFLDGKPDSRALSQVLNADWSGDEVTHVNGALIVRYHNGMHGSRAQHATLLRKLNIAGTARTRRTVDAIDGLLRASA